MRSVVPLIAILLGACSASQQDASSNSGQRPVAPTPAKLLVADAANERETSRKVLPPEELYELLSQSIWLVVAAPVEKGELQFNNVAQGSAVAVGPHRLLTNCHVVKNGQVIAISHGSDTRLVDVSSAHFAADICILTVNKVLTSYVSYFRTFDDIRPGEKSYTLGNPRGMELTLAEGLISAKRKIDGYDWIQTTAPMSPGSSGGGLFDSAGSLIGITTFLRRDSQQLNFASPIKLDFVPELLAQGGQRRDRRGAIVSNPQRVPGGAQDLTAASQRPSAVPETSEFEVHTFED